MSLKGLEPDTDYAVPVKFGDKIIANAKRIDRQTIQYTFTKDIEDLKYARVYIINSAQENKDVVRNSGDQTFKINVGEKAKAEKDINVDFGKLYHAETSENVNGKSQFTEFNPETGEFTQVFYLNPESKVINTSSTNDQNGREFGKVGFILASPHDGDKPRSVDYLANNTKIEVKKLPKGAKLPDAIIENPEGAQLATNAHGGFRNFKGEPMFTMDFGGGNKIDSPYVVVVKGHANKIDGKYTNLYSIGTLYGDGAASLFLDNSYTVQENSTDSEGEKETLGYFKEHHIYITKENGAETSRFEIPGATVSGTADEYYYTDKNIIPGYHFVKVDTDKLVNNPAYNDKGEITKGNYEVGKTKEVTYIYEKDIKKGSFKETHVYITKDFDGNVIEDKTITESKDATSGTKEESYTSAKVDKDGYVFTKVTADKGSDEVTISDDKKSVIPGNYVEDKNLSVTYEYVKQPGRFVEHHIYQTVDKDGKVVTTDDKVDVTEKDGKKIEGFSNENVSTDKKDKEGYTLHSQTEIKIQNDDSEKTYTNYVPGKTLEKTYIYTKTKEEPVAKKGSFKETHVYITKDFDGNVIEDKTITESKDATSGTKEESYTSAKVDKDGYVFTKVTADKGSDEVTISDDKKSVIPGNYVEDKNLSVTYEYVKQPGRFVEHHIYQTVDKDGKVVTTDDKVDVTEKDGKKIEGFSNENVSTDKKDKEGYTLHSQTEIKIQNDDSEKTYTNYVPGKVLEKTYIYTKIKEETVAHEDPKENPKEYPKKPNEPTPLVPLTPAEPVEPNESTPPTRDHKTPGTPVVTEVPPTKVVEIEKTPEEKPEESKEVENKEEKVEVKEIEKEEAPELVSKEFVKDKGLEAQKKSYEAKDDNRAPKTSDAGILSSIGLSSLAASGLAFLELRKRNKKNK